MNRCKEEQEQAQEDAWRRQQQQQQQQYPPVGGNWESSSRIAAPTQEHEEWHRQQHEQFLVQQQQLQHDFIAEIRRDSLQLQKQLAHTPTTTTATISTTTTPDMDMAIPVDTTNHETMSPSIITATVLPRQHPKKNHTTKTGNKMNGSGHPDPISSSVRISKPSATDVLFGRGCVIGSHPGNRTYRKVIQSKSLMYDAAKTKREKTFITLSIVHEMKEQLHHRFLKEDETTGLWIEVTNDEIARQKVAIALRDLRKTRRPPKSKQQPEQKKKSSSQEQSQHDHDAATRNELSVDNTTMLDKFNNESPGISTSKRKHRYDREDNLPDNIDDVLSGDFDGPTPNFESSSPILLSSSKQSNYPTNNTNDNEEDIAYAFVNMNGSTTGGSKRQRCFNICSGDGDEDKIGSNNNNSSDGGGSYGGNNDRKKPSWWI
mgnify:CR=1 FL=1